MARSSSSSVDLHSSSLHAVVGTSLRLRQEASQSLLAGWSGPIARQVEPEDLQRLILDLDTASIFADPGLHLVSASTAYLKRHRDRLVPLIGRPVIGGVMILVCEPPERKDDALFKALGKAGVLHACEEPDARHLADWLAARLSALPEGCTDPRRTAQALIDRIGADPDALLGAMEVLALLRTGAPVDAQAVGELYDQAAAQPLYAFCDAVLSGDTSKALIQLHAVGAEGAEAAIRALTTELRKVVACTETDDDAEAIRSAGLFGRPNLYYTRARARTLGRQAATRLLLGAVLAQRQARQGGADASLLIETLVLHARRVIRPGLR